MIWTFDTLKAKGHPRYRLYYAEVSKAEKAASAASASPSARADNRELPQIVGEMPVLSKAYWASRDFDKTTLEPPLGSGPYKIDAVDPGRSITYRRVPNYWAKDLPVQCRAQQFRRASATTITATQTIALEAFKAGPVRHPRRERRQELGDRLRRAGARRRA